jgi:hypothetical protein
MRRKTLYDQAKRINNAESISFEDAVINLKKRKSDPNGFVVFVWVSQKDIPFF